VEWEGGGGVEVEGGGGGGGGGGGRADQRRRYQGCASDGLEVTADPRYPGLRRAQRLSFALASIIDVAPGEGRQALLEAGSVAARLRAAAGRLVRQRKVLAALAAVKGLKP
jgi:hypothetical protein